MSADYRLMRVQLAHQALANNAVTNSYAIWRNPDNPDDIFKVGKVRRYGLFPQCHDYILEFYWVAEKQNHGCPWKLIHESTTLPYVGSGGSGKGVWWSETPSQFGPEHGLLRVPSGTTVTTVKGLHHVVISKQQEGGKWAGIDVPLHPLREYHLVAEQEHLLILQPFHNLHDHERRSLALVSDIVEHCPLNAWNEGVPYHTHRLAF